MKICIDIRNPKQADTVLAFLQEALKDASVEFGRSGGADVFITDQNGEMVQAIARGAEVWFFSGGLANLASSLKFLPQIPEREIKNLEPKTLARLAAQIRDA